MSWFTELAGKAESLLNNLDEQTGVALRSQHGKKSKQDKPPFPSHPNALYTFQSESEWNPRTKRTTSRTSKKTPAVNESKSSYLPTRKLSPTRNSRSLFKDSPGEPLGLKTGTKKLSPSRSKAQPYSLNHCPKTLVDEINDSDLTDCMPSRQRRRSQPSRLDLDIAGEDCNISLRKQNLEVENAMLKNELNVMNREVAQMLDRLKCAEEGNDVDSSTELGKTHMKLQDSEVQAQKSLEEKESLDYQLKLLKDKIQEIAKLEQHYRTEKQSIITENSALREANHYLEDRVNDLKKKLEVSDVDKHKADSELRHAQSTITGLEEDLTKSKGECERLEKEWDTYKLRVKAMLYAKDNEIKAMQDGINFSEEAKVLVEQLDSLKMERDELAEAICTVRSECDGMRLCLSQVESRHSAAERVVAALRDALKEERGARNRAETQLFVVSKELQNVQTETGQTIASLRTTLRDKEVELTQVREASSSIKSSDTSALNVADYDDNHDTIENEKIHYLTETLVQRQTRIDKLLSENNMLKIQLDKLESKFKMSNRTPSISQSVVNVQNTDIKTRKAISDSLMTVLSYRMATVIRRHPVFRIFVVIYMICLHFWVLTVLLTSTPPEHFVPNFSRS